MIYDMMLESYADKIESYARIELKTFLKPALPKFLLLPKKSELPKMPRSVRLCLSVQNFVRTCVKAV